MDKLKGINVALSVFSFVGLGLSIYSYFVEQQHDNYKAYCDISETISCSKTFKSKYGTGFGIIGDVFGEDFFLNKPNSLLGIIAYSVYIVLAQTNNKTLTTINYAASAASTLLSVFLGYVMVAKLGTVCVVCVTTYLVNILNFAFCREKLKCLAAPARKVKQK